MDDLDEWLDREAGLAALQGVCEGVSGSFDIPEAFSTISQVGIPRRC